MAGITIALAGNPNCGKTTIFNFITGARQHVGNYPGITVDKKYGTARVDGADVQVVDLPGTYSLTAYSQEEMVARRMLAEERPDVVLQVIDSGALERNLYLTVQFLEMGIPVILALNMMDEVRKRGDRIDSARLSRLLGVPVVETVGRSGQGIEQAMRQAVRLAEERQGKAWEPRSISYGPDLDKALDAMTAAIEGEDRPERCPFPSRWLALKYLENDSAVREGSLIPAGAREALEQENREVGRHLADTLRTYPEATIADYRYGYINGLLKDNVVLRHQDAAGRRDLSDRIDRVLTHRVFGLLGLALIFYLVYEVAFSLGSVPMDMVGDFFDWLAEAAGSSLDDGLLKSLVVSGIIKGVGGVLEFVPLILIMFLLIAFLEDSGYMARMAYMLDRVFRMFGLHGSSIMPYMISGGIAGGCAVPGVMATRALRSPKEKLATILTVPFMACGAKIPVFALLVAVFIEEEQRALVMLLLTLTGWAIALLSARVLRSTIIKGEPTPFVMELPPYRLPTLRGLLTHTWERGWQYIKKAGTIILAISILMWAAMTFPQLPEERGAYHAAIIEPLEKAAELAREAANEALKAAGLPELADEDDALADSEDTEALAKAEQVPQVAAWKQAKEELEEAEHAQASESLRHSLAGRIGVAMEPVSQYAGFEWKTNIALLGGFAAKEVLVSTLGTAYSLGEVDPEEADSLEVQIRSDPHWNLANALSLMIFVLIYAPCVVTVAAIRQETGTWKWPAFSLLFSTALAYGLAVAVYQVGKTLL